MAKNATSWTPGESGNKKGRKLAGKPSEALKKAAREFSEEAFRIVMEIARNGQDLPRLCESRAVARPHGRAAPPGRHRLRSCALQVSEDQCSVASHSVSPP